MDAVIGCDGGVQGVEHGSVLRKHGERNARADACAGLRDRRAQFVVWISDCSRRAHWRAKNWTGSWFRHLSGFTSSLVFPSVMEFIANPLGTSALHYVMRLLE